MFLRSLEAENKATMGQLSQS